MRGTRFRCAYGQTLSQIGTNSLRSRRKPRPDVPMSTTSNVSSCLRSHTQTTRATTPIGEH